jgi:beta-lactamase class C
LAQLATHTGGFPFFPPESLKTTEGLNQYLLAWKPSASTTPIYQYSNVSIGMLGRIIAATEHSDINQLYIDKILAPLHMSPIGIYVPKTLEANFAQGYLADGKPAPHSEIDLFPAAGELKMTIEDFSKFLQASLRLKGIPKEFSEAITLSQTPLVQVANFQQALGWQVNSFKNQAELMQKLDLTNTKPIPFKLLTKRKQQFNPNALIEKTGGTKGFRAYIALIPNSRSGIAIMTNRFVEGDILVKTARTLLFNKET